MFFFTFLRTLTVREFNILSLNIRNAKSIFKAGHVLVSMSYSKKVDARASTNAGSNSDIVCE